MVSKTYLAKRIAPYVAMAGLATGALVSGGCATNYGGGSSQTALRVLEGSDGKTSAQYMNRTTDDSGKSWTKISDRGISYRRAEGGFWERFFGVGNSFSLDLGWNGRSRGGNWGSNKGPRERWSRNY